jgi:hypothetical protein
MLGHFAQGRSLLALRDLGLERALFIDRLIFLLGFQFGLETLQIQVVETIKLELPMLFGIIVHLLGVICDIRLISHRGRH